MRNHMIRILKLAPILIVTIIMTGCGRGYHINGRVVVLSEIQDSEGFIAEVTWQAMPSAGQPVAGAKVRIVHELDDNQRPKTGTVWQREVLTNADGTFEIKDYAAPFDEVKVAIEVSKEGYKTAYTVYLDYVNKEPQTFYVVLVPKRV